jgi:VWFA-related protein
MVLVPVLAFGQAKFEEKVTVSYVEMPVTVLGRDGAPVRGLTKANFEIRDDGVQREIESFDAVDFSSEGGASPRVVSPLNPASRRNFLLLFDLSFSNPQALGRAQEAARGFIARSVARRDLVAVATVDVDRGARFLTAFTTDRELLIAAIRDPGNFRATDPLQIAGSSLQLTPETQGTSPSGERNDIALENMRDIERMSTEQSDSFRRTRVTKQVELLSDVARALQGLAGRKHLVLLSEGFDPRLVQGRGAGGMANQQEEDTAVESGELWKVDSDRRFGSAEVQRTIQLMADQFRRSDVVLHAVDIQGLRVANDTRGGARFNSNEGLFLLANSTGGTVFRNSNNIGTEFDRLSRQHEVVYVLGFHAPVGSAGEYHELKVRLVNVPNARLQHRGGYYDAGGESLVARTLTTAEVIVNDIAQDDVAFAAMAAAFPGDGERGQVPVVLEIAGKDLVRHARNNRATTDVFVYAFDEAGIVRDTLVQRVTLDILQAGERLRETGVRFYGTLDLPPGKYAVKTLVRVAESDRKGFQRIDLEVPSPKDVAVVPPLFFAEPGNWIMVRAVGDDRKVPYPFVLGEDTFIPAAHATLRRGEPRLFTIFVYNADADELEWETTPPSKLLSEARSDDVTKYLFALESFPADLRELAVTIRKKDSGDVRRVTTAVRVQ